MLVSKIEFRKVGGDSSPEQQCATVNGLFSTVAAACKLNVVHIALFRRNRRSADGCTCQGLRLPLFSLPEKGRVMCTPARQFRARPDTVSIHSFVAHLRRMIDASQPGPSSCSLGLTAGLIPAEWACAREWFRDGASCDCECGAYDPDCAMSEFRQDA